MVLVPGLTADTARLGVHGWSAVNSIDAIPDCSVSNLRLVRSV